jgi:hypothetical protein
MKREYARLNDMHKEYIIGFAKWVKFDIQNNVVLYVNEISPKPMKLLVQQLKQCLNETNSLKNHSTILDIIIKVSGMGWERRKKRLLQIKS